MSLRNAKDFWAGILFAVTGVLAIVTVQEHSLGSAARMGPAYFPTLLGGILTVLGVILSLRGLFSREALVEPDGGRVERDENGLITGRSSFWCWAPCSRFHCFSQAAAS